MRRAHVGIVLAAVTWITTSVSAVVAEVEIVATAQPPTVSVGETLAYEVAVTIRGTAAVTSRGEPALPDFNGFEVMATGSRQGFSMGSDGTMATRTYTYTLRAIRPGDFTFGPATLQVGGTKYRSGAVQVTVTPGTPPQRPSPFAPPPTASQQISPEADEGGYVPTKPIDLRLSAEPSQPYVGQQVVVTFAFYQSEDLHGDTRYEPPNAENCVMKELPAPPNTARVFGDRQYLVQRRRWAVFPTAAGATRIEPVRLIAGLSPFGPPEELYTNSVRLQVKPLPPAPVGAQFEGAVGRFTAEMHCDQSSVKAGETFTLTLVVRGAGNIHSLGVPTPEVPDWVDIYKSREERSADAGYGGVEDVVGGEARFHFLALAKAAGTVDVPPVNLVFFDPNRARYETARTRGASIEIKPGLVVEAAPEQTDQQMRHIKLAGAFRPASSLLVSSRWFWAVQAVPLLLLALSVYLSHRRNLLMADPRLAKSLQAPRVAQTHLAEARAALRRDDGSAFCAAAAHAITDFIGHRCGLPAADISTREALAALRSQELDEDLVSRIQQILEQCDRGRFAAGTQAEHGDMLAETVQVLRQLQAAGLGRR